MRINEKWEMGNEEMGKWEEGTHCTSLNKLWMFCDSSNVMRESQCPSVHSLRDHSWHQRGMQRHCITVSCSGYVLNFWHFVFLKFVESVLLTIMCI